MLELLRLTNEIVKTESVAAAVQHSFAPPVGESWLLNELIAWHDDPAGATLEWIVVGEAGHQIIIPIGATAINVRVSFSNYYALPVWIGAGWGVYINASGGLAAGKKFYLARHTHRARGLPAG